MMNLLEKVKIVSLEDLDNDIPLDECRVDYKYVYGPMPHDWILYSEAGNRRSLDRLCRATFRNRDKTLMDHVFSNMLDFYQGDQWPKCIKWGI